MLTTSRGRLHRLLHLLLVVAAVSAAHAHGFGQRYDLPVPLWLYLSGAAAAVLLSFVMVGIFVRADAASADYPRLNLLRWPLGRALVHPAVTLTLQMVSVALFLLVIAAGIFGTRSVSGSLVPVMVWVIWWVGLAYVSALVGNLWALINPWKVLFDWAESLYQRFQPGERLSLEVPYPNWMGVWPAVLLFLAFAWVEIVMPGSAQPRNLAMLILIYSLVTWWGMLTFGKETWLARGEAFTLAFGLLARFAPTEVRVQDPTSCHECGENCQKQQCVNCYECFSRAGNEQRELNLRPFAVGLLRYEGVTLSLTAFVLVMLSTVTYDGFTATPAWASIQFSLYSNLRSITGIGTLGLLAFVALFVIAYLLFCRLIIAVSRTSLGLSETAKVFAFSLLPIALAYHLAHYLTYLLTQGQLIIPLLSDPFGLGWNLLGTGDYQVDLNIVGARFAWYAAVIAIVVGHVIAVYLAHVVALRSMKEHRVAIRSQYPMLALMVGYTVVSLWIMAQPIVEFTPG